MILEELNSKIKRKSNEIVSWLDSHLERILVPLYTSVDIRFSDYKIAPVDTNVFPAGFNNLTTEFQDNVGNLFKAAISSKYPSTEKVLLVPELNTRNPFYWDNIYVIKSILKKAGYEVRVGIVNDEFTDKRAVFNSASGKEIEVFKVIQKETRAYLEKFCPDILLINNDFSEKCPKSLSDIHQPVLPPIEVGWHTRRKDIHFEFYNKLAVELAGILNIDPWIILIETVYEKEVDFDNMEDRKRVAETSRKLFSELKNQHSSRNVNYDPSLFIKSNSGTYGMAVINVENPDKIETLNSSDRKKMRVSKGGVFVRDVVIQECIPTSLRVHKELIAEPVIYLVNSKVAGMFYRANKVRSEKQNLNSRGMEFLSYDHHKENGIAPIYGLLSQTATIASGYEIEKIIKEGGCN